MDNSFWSPMQTEVSNGKMIKTFPIIQCSPPPGMQAKGRKPLSVGEEVAQKHSEWKQSLTGSCRHQQGVGGISSQAGRRQFLRWQAHFHAHIAQTDTHPRTSPCSREASFTLAYRAGEGGGQGPHSGWRGAISGPR